jgi:hypothetical protein
VHLCIVIRSRADYRASKKSVLPSEFSIIRGVAPSITATAELVVPRSMPMTCPLTFSPSLNFSAYPLRNCDAIGVLKADDLKEDVARGTAYQ